jgi:hypothetical protein
VVLFLNNLRQHLYSYHEQLPQIQRQLLVEHCETLDLVTQPKDLRLPPHHSPALEFLPIRQGYSCCQCWFLTSSRQRIRNHINATHDLKDQACTDNYRSVPLQTWSGGSRANYWIVQASAIPLAIPGRSSSVPSELYRLEQQEIQRLKQLEQDCIAQETELEDSNSSLWLQFTQWPAQFAGLPLDVIATSAVQPGKKPPKTEFVLGNWDGEPWVSPLADEVKLQQLVQLLDPMFDRCNDTLASTPRVLRRWIHTNTLNGYWKRPFQLLGRPSTQRRYRALWKQFFCFVFRVWTTDSSLQHEVPTQGGSG